MDSEKDTSIYRYNTYDGGGITTNQSEITGVTTGKLTLGNFKFTNDTKGKVTIASDGVLTVADNAQSVFTNNGEIDIAGTLTIGSAGKMEQGGKATFAGAGKTDNITADHIIVSDGSETVFTAAPSTSVVLTSASGFASGESIKIKVASNTEWTIGQGTGGLTGTAFASVANEASLDKLDANKDITISDTQLAIEA